jgi:hypothetical protein
MCHKKVNILRFASLVIAIAVLLSALGGLNVFAAQEGTCGKDLKWSYSGTTLTIKGSGAMKNYNEVNKAPWYKYKDQITTVILPEKLESIGILSFYDCTSLKSVVIPNNVKSIGDKAFYNCTGLRTVVFGSGLKSIGRAAFYKCEKLASVTFPNSLEKIGDKAFYFCSSIVTLTIPESVTSLGKQAFTYCESLIRVEIKAKIKTLPEWCFYGCTNLSEVKLSDTITNIDPYAFKRCDELVAIYCSDKDGVAKKIRDQVAEDLPYFEENGVVAPGQLGDSTQNTIIETDKKDNIVSQTTTSTQTQGGATVVTQVQSNANKGKENHYSVDLTITVEGEDGWDDAILMLRKKLAEINDSYSSDHILDYIKITLYLKGVDEVSEDFLKELSGRNVTLEVITMSGNSWEVDCEDLHHTDVKDDTNVNYTLTDAPNKAKDKLGTDNCYKVTFDSNSKLNTSVVISLPKKDANGKAFLYQVSGGKYKRIQGTIIDSNGNARFFLSSINKNGKYVVGVNVPGESFDDVIISDQASDPFGAIARLEKIEYVPAGPRTLAGFTIGQFSLIVLGVVAFIAIVIGICMYMISKNRQKQFAFMKNINIKKPNKK